MGEQTIMLSGLSSQFTEHKLETKSVIEKLDRRMSALEHYRSKMMGAVAVIAAVSAWVGHALAKMVN